MTRDAWAKACLAMLVAGHTGCGLPEKIEEEADRLRATSVGGVVVAAGEAIGFLPVLHCGPSAREDALDLLPALQQKLGHCAEVATDESVTDASGFQLRFPPTGCKVGKSNWTGQIEVVVGGGDDRSDVTLDFRQLAINGHPVDGLIKRTACGDLDTYEVHVKSRVLLNRGMKPIDVVFDGTASMKPGVALIGTDLAVVNGAAGADIDGKGVTLVFTDLQWEPGANLPLKGTLALEQPNGKETTFTFDDDKGEMTISVNGGAPHTVPLP